MVQETNDGVPDGDAPPIPTDFPAFRDWLRSKPQRWSVVIAARAALRVAPLAREANDLEASLLLTFRATAIARFAAAYPATVRAAARAAADAISGVVATDALKAAAAAARAAVYSDFARSSDVTRAAAAAATGVAAAASAAVATGVAANVVIDQDAQQLDRAARERTRLMVHRWREDESTTAGSDWRGFIWPDQSKTRDEAQLAMTALWATVPPPKIGGAWEGLKPQLRRLGNHWSVWVGWYEDVLHGITRPETSYAAFTDVEGNYRWKDKLPWQDGAEAVNKAIAARLEMLRTDETLDGPSYTIDLSEIEKEATVRRLAEVASPQPFVSQHGQLDAGPNQVFDIARSTEDLSTLPLRQQNLIEGIFSDLPSNAPPHLKKFLRLYDKELKIRGTQPILGILRDNADVIAAAISAPRAEDEWLDPGMRKAFDLFTENHNNFVKHFPLDAEREETYAQTSVDEESATGEALASPLAQIAKATEQAHKAGIVTDNFRAAVEGMNDLARVTSTLSPPATQLFRAVDIRISADDRPVPVVNEVTLKKRVVLGAIGFLKRAKDLIDERSIGLTASGLQISDALNKAVQALIAFLR